MGMSDHNLWKAFSQFIRLRDADQHGYCQCITCHRKKHWKEMQCGHGIGRQHKATKFHEQNNHAQCSVCNAFEGGRREVYKVQVDIRYGSGTWDKLEVLSRGVCKRGKFEIEVMTKHYREQVRILLSTKKIAA